MVNAKSHNLSGRQEGRVWPGWDHINMKRFKGRSRALSATWQCPISCRRCKGTQTKIFSCQRTRTQFKGQGVLPCLLVYCLLPGNLKPANQAVHGTNHSKPMESLNFRCTVRRTGTACGIGTVGFLRLIKVSGPSWRKKSKEDAGEVWLGELDMSIFIILL